jgi:hypothetical protein
MKWGSWGMSMGWGFIQTAKWKHERGIKHFWSQERNVSCIIKPRGADQKNGTKNTVKSTEEKDSARSLAVWTDQLWKWSTEMVKVQTRTEKPVEGVIKTV